uniref:uncharacterized protein LOC120335234 n=1 Tax=Styela clava TaxID=7725 RepID=UPI001939B2D6|nr:uncharacterized protein LOC120335234 [Styela clava]
MTNCEIAMICVLMYLLLGTSTAKPSSPSVLSCKNNLCYRGDQRFSCRKQGLLCCDGPNPGTFQVLSMRDGFECCQGSGRMYNILDQICVHGAIRARAPEELNCGKNVYNTTSQVCCNGNIHNKHPGGECCLGEYLTGPDDSCCSGVKYKKSEQTCCLQTHNDPRRRRQNLTALPYGRCCLDVPYDPLKQSCDHTEHGALRVNNKTSPGIKSCGSSRKAPLYDPKTHGCCMGPRPQVYDMFSFLCASGKLYQKTDPNQNDICFHAGSGGVSVTPYTRDDKTVCVNGGVYNLGPQEAMCGSSKIYNTSADLCCGYKFYKGLKLLGNTCCDSGTNYYDPDTQICCVNEVSAAVSYNSGARCCRKKPYYPETHDCNGDSVEKIQCPLFEQKCTITAEKIQAIRGKVYVYVATVEEIIPPSKRKTQRQWKLGNMKLIKSKRGQISLKRVRGKSPVTLKSRNCDCAEYVEENTRYIFVTRSPVRSKKLSIKSDISASDFVIPITKIEEMGLLLKGLLDEERT